MHLLDGVRKEVTCLAFEHETSALILAKYVNQFSPDGWAFVLLTAGPEKTNALTGIASADRESREPLVIGRRVKSSDLTVENVRHCGFHEVDGLKLAEPVIVISRDQTTPVSKAEFQICLIPAAIDAGTDRYRNVSRRSRNSGPERR
jgi:thiamine pyrophosphate-dependent acetolactate synthase large subunit-like protein